MAAVSNPINVRFAAVDKLDKPSEMDEFAASAGGTVMQVREAERKCLDRNKILTRRSLKRT